MKIKYNIISGIAPFVAVLSGTSGSYSSNHNAIGTYQFTNVVNGVYSLKITDSQSCVVLNSNINVDNTNFVIVATPTGTNIDSENIYSGNTVSVKENSYTIDSLPMPADAATMSYTINYSLNTSVNNGNSSLSSLTVYKNNIQINNDNTINNSKTGAFTISLTNVDVIKIKLYGNTTKIGGNGSAISTVNVSLSNFRINGNSYSLVNLSGATKSLILNS